MRRGIANPRSVCSLGLDSSTSSAISGAPPGYTSQRDANSSIAVINEYEEDDGEAISHCSSSPPLPQMETCKEVPNSIYILPSPYSTEDLSFATPENTYSLVVPNEQDQDPTLFPRLLQVQSCPHGYTHTHSQCTPVSSFMAGFHSNHDVQHNDFHTTTNMPPVASNSYYPPHQHQLGGAPIFYGPPILSTDNLFGANVQSRPSLRPYYPSPTDEHPPTLQAGNLYQHQHQHQQTTLPCTTINSNHDYNLSSPPYHQNIYPPPCTDIRILTYPPVNEFSHEYDDDYEEYGYEEDGERRGDLNGGRSSLGDKNRHLMNSTATILSPSEEPTNYQNQDSAPRSPHHCHRHPSLLNGVSRESTTLDHKQAVTTTKNLTKSVIKINSRGPTAKSSVKEHSTLPTQAQPTNYVHLSRKHSPSIPTSKLLGWRKIQPTQMPLKSLSSSPSSAITGIFIINPELNISPGLLNAMEDPVFRSSSDQAENTRESRAINRRTNLRLEIENGGIDVDIRLVSPTSGEPCIWNRDRGGLQTFCDAHAAVQTQVNANTTTVAFNGVGIPPAEAFEKPTQQQSLSYPRLPTTPRLPTIRMPKNLDQPSTKRKEAILKPAVAQRAPAWRDKKQSRPTTIHLRIKQADSLNHSVSQKRPSTGPLPFPLIARIHAPNPRPPFHLFASTIDIPNSTPDSTCIAKPHTSTLKETRETENQSRTSPIPTFISNNEASGFTTPAVNPPRRIRRRSSKSHPQSVSSHHRTATPSPLHTSSLSSPVYLHLPRTFHGPLTIHISSGDVGAHLRLSEGLEKEVALIRESEFGRGYFVGALGSSVDVDGEEDEDRRGEQERDGGEKKLGNGGGDHNTIFIHPDENRARGTDNNPICHHPLEQEDDRESVEIENKTQLHDPNDTNINHIALSDDSSLLSLPDKAEWCGDRIEVRVGSGEVYLQFEDEVDPFGTTSSLPREKGFWKRGLGCLGSFLD